MTFSLINTDLPSFDGLADLLGAPNKWGSHVSTRLKSVLRSAPSKRVGISQQRYSSLPASDLKGEN